MEATKMKDSGSENIAEEKNKMNEDKSFESVKNFSHKGKGKISERLKEIEDEFDIEKIIHMHVSGIAITGALLGFFIDKRWFVLPALAATVLALHSLRGVAPQIPVLRKLGFRTKDEISREKYSLKAMRGDFKNTASADAVWEAAE